MLEFIGALLSGGATGLIGIGLQSVFGWLNKREDYKHQQAMKHLDIEISKQEWTSRVQVAQVEGQTSIAVADAETQAASYNLEPKRYATGRPEGWVGETGWVLLTLLDALRGAVRPVLTIYLTYLTHKLYEQSQETLASLPDDVIQAGLIATHTQIVTMILYLFATCGTWWFGSRLKHIQEAMKK